MLVGYRFHPLSFGERRRPRSVIPGLPCACARFHDWLVASFDSAKMAGFLTLGNLRQSLMAEQHYTVSKKVLRRTLKSMGYRYQARKQVWLSRRAQPAVQERKKKFLEWVVWNSEQVVDPIDGTAHYKWTIPCGFFDETYIWKAVARLKSWTKKGEAVPGRWAVRFVLAGVSSFYFYDKVSQDLN